MLNRTNSLWRLGVLLAALSPSVIAQTSTSLVSADMKSQYYVIKQAFTIMIDRREILLNIRRQTKSFNLFDTCSDNDLPSGSEYLGSSEDNGEQEVFQPSDDAANLANLALEIVRLRITLTKLGYPESVWKPPLIEHEDEMLPLYVGLRGKPYDGDDYMWKRIEKVKEVFRTKILKKLRVYRKQNAPHLPNIFYVPSDCGAGEMAINVRTEPRNGRVFFIPVFAFRLCETQKIDPYDRETCNRWREAGVTPIVEVAGDYFYFAFWPDGTIRKGLLSFTKLRDGQTVTFTKQ